MLIQALAAYADCDLAEQLADRAFEEKPVPYWIEIDGQGCLLGVVSKRGSDSRGERLLIAKSPENRNSGVKPLLAADAIQYVVGPAPDAWTDAGEEAKHVAHHEGFIKLIEHAARQTEDAALQACQFFYSQPKEVEKARAELIDLKASGGAIVALSVRPGMGSTSPGGPVIRRKNVRRFWIEYYDRLFTKRHQGAGEGVCLISGRRGPLAITHEKIKGAASLGGQPAGVSLMSFDKEAFESYGWSKNVNSPVHPERAMAYVLALNDLMRIGPHRQGWKKSTAIRTRVDLCGIGFLFWTREPIDEIFPDSEQVAELLDRIASGTLDKSKLDAINDNEFYLLAVSGNGGRLVVRDWFWDKLERVLDSLKEWYEQLRIADVFSGGELSRPPSIERLLGLLTPRGVKVHDNLNAERSMRFVRRALEGTALPSSILAAALKRLRAENGAQRLNPDRNALIRLCVNDRVKEFNKGDRLMGETLDDENEDVAYLCGRLLAVYEDLQYTAQGELNSNVTDRYFTMASTSPLLAFTRLADLARKHLGKLRRYEETKPAYHAIDNRISGLIDRIKGNFPRQLNLEQQGRFVIGYHHQKAEFAKARKEAVEKKKADVAPAVQQ